MLPRRSRLTRASDFSLVYRRGRRFRGHGLTLCAYLGSPANPSCFAVVASTKVDRRATVRNRLRRVASATMAELWGVLPPQGLMLVAIVQKGATSATTAEFRRELGILVAQLPQVRATL